MLRGAIPKAGFKWLLVVVTSFLVTQAGLGFPFSPAPPAEGRQMLLSTPTGMVNVFIEPQFAEVSSQSLLTIQVSDFETFNLLGLKNEESYRLDLTDEFFPFIGYGYRWQLGYKLGGFNRLADIEVLENNFSPEVRGYKWMGLYVPNPDYVPEEGEDDESEMHVGYCLPTEVDDARFGSDVSYEAFHVYPMFQLPTNEQLNTIWCS